MKARRVVHHPLAFASHNYYSTLPDTSTDDAPHTSTIEPASREPATGKHVSQASINKQRKTTEAAARNKAHKFSLMLDGLANGYTSIKPSPPPPPKRQEVKIKRALQLWKTSEVAESITKECNSKINKYQALKPIKYSDIEATSQFVRAQVLVKMKRTGIIKSRIALGGDRQSTDSYISSDTYAGTSDATNRIFMIACGLKDAADRGRLDDFRIVDFDLPSAFCQCPLTRESTGGRQLVTRLPTDIPDSNFAGQWYEVVGGVEGLKQNSNTAELSAELKRVLRSRYGEDVVYNDHSSGVLNIELKRNADHSVTLTMANYIKALLKTAGMDDVPSALSPSLRDLFLEPTDTTPIDQVMFQKLVGALLYMLPVRFDIRKEVVHLCSRNHAPTQSDQDKLIQVLRYLKGCPDIGPTYSANSTTPGVSILAAADAAHAVHTDGSSQSAHHLYVTTDVNNAPFLVHCGAERKYVTPDPMSAEYISLGKQLKTSYIFVN